MYLSGSIATMNALLSSAGNDVNGRLALGLTGIDLPDETRLSEWKLSHIGSLQEKP